MNYVTELRKGLILDPSAAVIHAWLQKLQAKAELRSFIWSDKLYKVLEFLKANLSDSPDIVLCKFYKSAVHMLLEHFIG